MNLNVRHLYLASWAIVVGIISWREIHDCKKLPWPPRFVFTGLTFLAIDALSFLSTELAGVTAFGMVLAFVVTNQWKTANCNHDADCTSQPGSYAFLDAAVRPPGAPPSPATSPTPTNPQIPGTPTPQLPGITPLPGQPGQPQLPPGELPALPPGGAIA